MRSASVDNRVTDLRQRLGRQASTEAQHPEIHKHSQRPVSGDYYEKEKERVAQDSRPIAGPFALTSHFNEDGTLMCSGFLYFSR
jgi:hypothetical protein